MRARALFLGLALLPLNVYWMILAELRYYVILSLNPLFVTPVFFLLCLAGVNLWLRRRRSRWAFTPAELFVVYLMLALSCCVATHDYAVNLMGIVAYPAWFGTEESGWRHTVWPNLPPGLWLNDLRALDGFYKGSAEFYRWPVLLAWSGPALRWLSWVGACLLVFFCAHVLIRRAWVEHTSLSFPVVRLPLAMVDPGQARGFFRSPVMWIGFSLAFGLDLLNGLHELYPTLPYFQLRAQRLQFADPPWTVLNGTAVSLYPFAIGLAYFVPLDVSFSAWFFYLFYRAQQVVGYQLGYHTIRDYPFIREQGIGAWLTFGFLLLWSLRGYLSRLIRSVLRGKAHDADEVTGYRWALLGLGLGTLYLVWFWVRAGMGWATAAVSMLSYLLLSLAITRVRAEAGTQHTVWDLEPKNLFMLVSQQSVTPREVGAAAMQHWFHRLNRCHPLPTMLEGAKVGQLIHLRARSLALPMILALAVATPLAIWACLDVVYRHGGMARCLGFPVWVGREAYGWMHTEIRTGHPLEPLRWWAVGGATGLTSVLWFLRTRFAGFFFHPLGYCVGPGLYWLWFPFLVSWSIKWAILRYGGLKLYRRSIPLFLGLILGDYLAAALWSLFGIWVDLPAYQIFH